MQTAEYPEVPDDFGHWLAGFIDGEGCFTIDPKRTASQVRYSCRLAIRLRDDDAPLLLSIAQRTGCGSIDRDTNARAAHHARGGGNPQARWLVVRKMDCLRMITILDAHPLLSKKARDYAIWREAARIYARLHPSTCAYDWRPIARLRDQLMAGRAYAHAEIAAEPEPSRLWPS